MGVATEKLERKSDYVRYQVLTAASVKMIAFSGKGTCSLVEEDRCFSFNGTCCITRAITL
jgi:hypothetical protein